MLVLAHDLFRRGEFDLLARLLGFPRLLLARGLGLGSLQLSPPLFLVRLALGSRGLGLLFGFRRPGLSLAGRALRLNFCGGTIFFGLFGSLFGFGGPAFGFCGPGLFRGFRRLGAALVVFTFSAAACSALSASA